MPNDAGKLLRDARKAAGMSQTQVYLATRISESNLARWEGGESKPNMEDLYTLELLYHAPGLWSKYLLETSPAYAAHHPAAAQDFGLLARVVGIGKGLEDVQKIQDAVERDLLDGVVDDRKRWDAYMQVVQAINTQTGALMLGQSAKEG